MAKSAAFEAVADALEETTSLNRIEARGTVRIALREAGLDAASVTTAQLAVVVAKLLPGELRSRGIPDEELRCREISQRLARVLEDHRPADTLADVFRRLGS